MKKLFLFSIFLAFAFNSKAQKKVALHSGGTTTIFGGVNPFIDAYNASVDGDTLYLPGGVLTYPLIIDKGLTIYGAGHYPDSTTATGKTFLVGSLTIQQNADSLHLEGIELSGSIVTTTNHKIDYLTITRCKMEDIAFYGDQSTPCEYSVIKECVIGKYTRLDNATLATISNNIMEDRIYGGNNNMIYNNIMLYSGNGSYYIFNTVTNSAINNNIILKPNTSIFSAGAISNSVNNNIFSITCTSASNSLANNYHNINIATLFVNQTGFLFDYSFDFNLVAPGTYPGTDATQVSIYGGLFPYKAASVPRNPHISFKSVAPATDASGLLNINFKVNAQQE